MATVSEGENLASTEYVLAAPGKIRSRERNFGGLDPEWARVRFRYCGLCGSDISHFEGRPGVTYPVTIGHEFVGEVLAVGSGVDGIAPGEAVTSDLNYRCKECDHCRAGRSHLCRVGQQGLFTNRGFADLGDIHASYLIPLAGPPSPHLTLVEPLSCVLHAQDWARLGEDDRVLVIGAGSIGLCMAIALRHHPAEPKFEITDLKSSRLERIAAVLGHNGRATPKPMEEYDVVFDVSGTESGLERASWHIRGGGRLCSMSHPRGDPVSPFLVGAILRKDVTFTVSYLNGELTNMAEAARLLEHRWDPAWGDLIEVVPIERLQKAYEGRHRSASCKTVIEVQAD